MFFGERTMESVTAPSFEDQPPQAARVSAYDERHLATYSCSLMPRRKEPTGAKPSQSFSASIP
jgi:hypothetical protein